MLWANRIAVHDLFQAPSLQALQQRYRTKPLPEATMQEMKEQMKLLKQGKATRTCWTVHPYRFEAASIDNENPVGESKQVDVVSSAIRLSSKKLGILFEAEFRERSALLDASARSIEILRQMPVAVTQYSMKGQVQYQNPQAVAYYGVKGASTIPFGRREGSCTRATEVDSAERQDSLVEVDEGETNDFVSHFVDRAIGQNAWNQVLQQDEAVYTTDEIQQFTANGTTQWHALAARQTRDPLSGEPIIIQTARDVTEVIQARHSQEAARRKAEFMDVLAHEIRTPLHQIIGSMDLLEASSDGLSEQQRETIQQVQMSTASLMAIINDLLDYSQLENGMTRIERIPYDLINLLSSCITTSRTSALTRGVTVQQKIMQEDAIPHRILGDPNRVRQIISNLLSNAVKFTNEGGSVTLRVLPQPAKDAQGCRRLRFEVSDTGIGIDESQQKRIFVKYQQANSTITRNYGGTGLGLAICKGLVEAMGGTIGLTSELGKGTTVFFEVPLEEAVHFSTSASSDDDDSVQLTTQSPSLQGMSISDATSSPVSPFSDKGSSSLNILIVEDNTINQKVVASMLRRLRHTFQIAENGQVAVDMVHEYADMANGDLQPFDVILMDLQMPVMDGVEATKAIRNVYSKTILPIIGLTANFQQSQLEYLKNTVGMNTCIGKPVKMHTLKDILENVHMLGDSSCTTESTSESGAP